MTEIMPRIKVERSEYSDRLSSVQRADYTTKELVLGLVTAGTLVGSVVGNHYLMDYRNLMSGVNLGTFGGEVFTFGAFYLGHVFSRKPSKGLESKISLN